MKHSTAFLSVTAVSPSHTVTVCRKVTSALVLQSKVDVSESSSKSGQPFTNLVTTSCNQFHHLSLSVWTLLFQAIFWTNW